MGELGPEVGQGKGKQPFLPLLGAENIPSQVTRNYSW